MAIVSKFKFAGIQIANNELSAAPDGALVEANNVIIQGRDTIEPRRGQFARTYNLEESPNEIFYYQGNILVQYGTSLARDTGSIFFQYENLEGPTDQFAPPDPAVLRAKGVEINKCFYFTTDKGVYVIDTPTAVAAILAGAPKAPDVFNRIVPEDNVGGWLAFNKQVAYRVVIGKKDFNGTLYLGTPTGRDTYVNQDLGSFQTLLIDFNIPVEVNSTSYFWRLYRTTVFDVVDIAGNPQFPGDEMFLVKEAYFTTDQILAGNVEVVDSTPDSFLGVALYTNPNTGEGLGQTNDPPPLCKDMTFWNNRMWFANTSQPHRLYLDLIGELAAGDIITIDGVDFMAVFEPEVGSYGGPEIEFAIVNNGTPSENLYDNARSLVNAINDNTATTGIRAYYISTANDPPGSILIERVALNGAQFGVTYSRFVNSNISELTRTSNVVALTVNYPGSSSTSFGFFNIGDQISLTSTAPNDNFPVGTKTIIAIDGFDSDTEILYYAENGLDVSHFPGAGEYSIQRVDGLTGETSWNPSLSSTPVLSANEENPQRVYYSKLQQPEAVPPLNYLEVGNPGKPILRIVPLRDKLFVFKPEGIYIIAGEAPFRVDLLDDTVRLVAADSAVAVSNQIHCLTTQGVVAVSDGGVNIVSGPIEPEIRRLLRDGFLTESAKDIFGVSHESDHLYTLWVPEETGEDPTRAWVYSTTNGNWVTWTLPRRCGRVNPNDDILHMGRPAPTPTLVRERKDYTNRDFADDNYVPAPASYDGTEGTLTWPAPEPIFVGDLVEDDATFVTALVTEVISSGSPYVVRIVASNPLLVSISPVTTIVRKAFECVIQWKTIDGGDPTQTKHFRDFNVHIRSKLDHRLYTVYFATDLVPTETAVPMITPDFIENIFPFPWGPHREPTHERLHVPQDKQRGSYLHVRYVVREAAAGWSLNGISLVAELNSERNRK